VQLALAGGGCSFALSGPDPKLSPTQEPKCDVDKTSVLGDSLLATAAGITTLAVGADNGAAALIPAVIGAVFVGAAIHGNNTVNACRAAKEEYIASLHAPPPPIADERAERAQFLRPPAMVAPPPAAPAPDASAPAPAAAPAPAPEPPAPAAPAPAWSAFWKEVR